MSKLKVIAAAIGMTWLGIAAANAAPGYSTANVNLRTGPDLDFPSVEVVADGTPIEVAGCLKDESWCDVIVGPNRGWMFSEYIAFERNGDYVALPDVGIETYKIPAVTFAAREYWAHYYVGRPWYADREKWIAFAPRPRAGWRAPPQGVRIAGWWRDGYRAPEVGLEIPLEHWKKHHHKEH